MKIEGKDAEATQSLLQESMDVGMQYMVYNRESPVLKLYEGNDHFATRREAQQVANYLTERSGEENIVLPLQPIEQQLTRQLELQQLRDPSQTVPKDIVIDEGFMLKQEIVRQQILIEVIQQAIEKEGLKLTDTKEVAAQIARDTSPLAINAVRTTGERNELMTVHIQQANERGVEITSVTPVIDRQLLMGGTDLIQDRVSPTEALEIKALLQQESQQGNRFVVFLEDTTMKKQDLTFYKNAFDALESAHENTTDRDRYSALSITVLDKQMDKAAGLEKESLLERSAQRVPDQELSR